MLSMELASVRDDALDHADTKDCCTYEGASYEPMDHGMREQRDKQY